MDRGVTVDGNRSEEAEDYVDIRVAAASSGLTPDQIRWVCEQPVDDRPEVGDVPLIRSFVATEGVLKVHLQDVLTWAGTLADSGIHPDKTRGKRSN
jgi:hypothetical protein